jgi:tRNA dimethylallyltransferase
MASPVVLLGPTASGKSEVAMAAATAVAHVEIVVVDAMQVYRGMDIGTAKPSAADRAAVVHHCLDLAGPDEEMSVTEYRRAYDAALDGIAARPPARALLVAGTGLYLTAAIDRLDLPGAWPDVRAALDREPDTVALYDRLKSLDPDAADKIDPANRRRILRALEVTIASGQPFSSFGPGVAAFPPTNVVQFGIRWARDDLAERIEQRVQAMMAAGLLDEVARLSTHGLSPTAGQALGYKELIEHLDGRLGLDEAVAAIVSRTRRFAARQDRWFRRDPRVRWIDVDATAADPLAEVRSCVIEALRR